MGPYAPREPWAYGEPALSDLPPYASCATRLSLLICGGASRARGLRWRGHWSTTIPRDGRPGISTTNISWPGSVSCPDVHATRSARYLLAAGGWYDFWTDQRFDGTRWITYDAELETLPRFVRAGAVIPMGPKLQYVNERAWDPLTFEFTRATWAGPS